MKNKELDSFATKCGFENFEDMRKTEHDLVVALYRPQSEIRANNIDYCQVIEMSREEKVAMYMKLTKRELIEMLLQNQELLEQRINSDFPPRWYTTCVSGTTINSSGVETHKVPSTK